ncbi:MAG: asparaginase [Synergistaceae bacterium]|nr:asparaginase [Synergistaceae bacterium]
MKFALFTTGGTIASIPTERGLTPGLSAEELIRLCPDLMGFEHDIEAVEVMSKDSSNMRPDDWLALSERIRARAGTCDAAVVLHGTDTLAWTATALSYLLNGLSIPVVLTGSMLPAGAPDSDASGNLFSAIQFAMQLAMYRRGGVSLAFDGALLHGPRAAKVDSRRKHAFISVDYPILGEMRDRGTHKIAWLTAHAPKLTSERPWGPSPALEQNIALLPVFPGMSPALLDTLTDTAKPRAVVLEGYGLGGIPDTLLPAIKRASESGVLFVARTQALFGGADLTAYEVGRKNLDLGVLSAHDMTREALMVKMMLCLPLCSSREGLEHFLNESWCDDVLL